MAAQRLAGGSAARTGFLFPDLQIFPRGTVCLSAERSLDMSKQRDIEQPKTGERPSIIPIIEA